MSWSLEQRDGEIYVYSKGSVQLDWGGLEDISSPLSELKGTSNQRRTELLKIKTRKNQFSVIFSKYLTSYSDFSKQFAGIHNPLEFVKKIKENLESLSKIGSKRSSVQSKVNQQDCLSSEKSPTCVVSSVKVPPAGQKTGKATDSNHETEDRETSGLFEFAENDETESPERKRSQPSKNNQPKKSLMR